jgi:hypothetical protein
VRFRIDPILEPIGCGFAASLNRYVEVRRRYPDAEMMMGIGNLTELTDADSAGINVLLLGICQELGIRSVLTTQVINWARTSVRECDLARRLVHYAVRTAFLPSGSSRNWCCCAILASTSSDQQQLEQLAAEIKDKNYRIFAEGGQIHLINAKVHCRIRRIPVACKLMAAQPDNLDAFARVLPGLRDRQSRDGTDAGQRVSSGRSAGLGIPDRAGGIPPQPEIGAATCLGSNLADASGCERSATRTRPPRSECLCPSFHLTSLSCPKCRMSSGLSWL